MPLAPRRPRPAAVAEALGLRAARPEPTRSGDTEHSLRELPQTVVHGDEELAAIAPLQVVFRVHMVMAELWDAQQTGRFDFGMIERQLGRAEHHVIRPA
jgi:hypothetical protein